MSHTPQDFEIATGQHEQEILQALDRIIEITQRIQAQAFAYRADVAAGMPSIAKAQQLAVDLARLLVETGRASGMVHGAQMAAQVNTQIRETLTALGEKAA